MTIKAHTEKLPVRNPIDPTALQVKIHDRFANQWLLLTRIYFGEIAAISGTGDYI